ncbi:MAG: response regulator [Acidobacteria bacterium]|nr:response regulator [Acidobacteriota bacterium]MBI3654999.1 response regulator [Acidobacteriota bacterium]
MPGPVLAAVDDLYFAAKIEAAAKAVGVVVEIARTPDEILDKARALCPALILIDLNSSGCRPLESIQALKKAADTKAIRLIAFLSHVQVDLKAAAVAAGADIVLPRSLFSQNLSTLLAQS